jgi:hypothetical protein
MEERIQALEARLCAVTHFLGWFAAVALVNLVASLWYFQSGAREDWNFIAVTLTIFEVFLIVALAGGFWMLRGAAQAAAKSEAQVIAADVAEDVARRSFLDWQSLTAASTPMGDSHDLNKMIESLSDSNGNADEQRPRNPEKGNAEGPGGRGPDHS